jgi:hypothetical protein
MTLAEILEERREYQRRIDHIQEHEMPGLPILALSVHCRVVTTESGHIVFEKAASNSSAGTYQTVLSLDRYQAAQLAGFLGTLFPSKPMVVKE